MPIRYLYKYSHQKEVGVNMAGIVGYGAYIPRYRIKAEEIARVWGEYERAPWKGLNIREKSVPGLDEDTITIAIEAARNALKHAGISGGDIGAIYIGSESHPYAVKPSGTVLAEAIGAAGQVMISDLEFACKAGTAAIQLCMSHVDANRTKYGLAIGADTSQGLPGDALEYTAAAGGAAFVIGPDDESVAIIEHTVSYGTDTPDFWRRETQEFPRHGARFTGKPAYFKHIINATKMLLEQTGTKIEDYDYFVFHQPNGKFPLAVAKALGVPREKLEPGLLNPIIGNTYSGATMLGLAATLDVAQPGDRILATSFGSGAGSDSFSILVTDQINKKERPSRVQDYVSRTKYLDYGTYVRYRRKLKKW